MTTGLRTKVFHNSLHLVMLPVAIAPCPAGSHGRSSSPSAFSIPEPTPGDAQRCIKTLIIEKAMMQLEGACGAPTLGNSRPTHGNGYNTMPYNCDAVTPTPLVTGVNAHPTRLASRVSDLQAISRCPPLPGDLTINNIVPDRPHQGDFNQSLESC